ncbi:MAG: cell division protein FtsK [Legionellales bacterium RIFCSPHIGHO2_12_FULL_42_9]|nr:MAG: cell division protein FtsK [Legionellales bacterium RIFCSPHIGHO2_12_FULL_42_9]
MAKQYTEKKVRMMKNNLSGVFTKRLSEGGFILVVTCALLVILSLATYSPADPTWSYGAKSSTGFANAGGQVGATISYTLYLLLGYIAYLFPFSVAYVAWLILRDHRALRNVDKPALLVRTCGLSFLMIGGCGLLSLLYGIGAGGLLGRFVALGFDYALNAQGAALLLLAIFLVGVTWLTGLSWIRVTELIGRYTLLTLRGALLALRTAWNAGQWFVQSLIKPLLMRIIHQGNGETRQLRRVDPVLIRRERVQPVLKQNVPVSRFVVDNQSPLEYSAKTTTRGSVAVISPATVKPRTESRPNKLFVTPGLPDLALLDKGEPGKALGGYTHQELEILSRDLEQHLLDFGIQADVVAVHPGPVITRFELQLAAGVKASKLSALSKDLARSLSVFSVRVVEIIPGKTVVGLELPNQYRQVVRLSEILSSEVYQQAHSPLTLALGVDIAGYPMVVDLAKMPHLLVAGTTGSGKSVGINAMILSILFKSTPAEVRLIMIDPKMLELSVYDGIPHLLTPVVTDMREAASALRWCVGEMERRYRLMAALGVRNLAGYNTKLAEAVAEGEPLVDMLWKPTDSMEETAPLLEQLPYIIVIIDELADMMMVVGKKVEQLIARIAQKARAAGIHLILATQRPSVDVLTGLIKSNIPTRVSFQVSSKIDSRTILDQQGAESLLGHGDMLYLAPGTGAPLRVHGALVDDKEVHRIASDWRLRGQPEYIDEITQISSDLESGFTDEGQAVEEADPLYDQAVEFVIQTRKASISGVQRRFKIGYNRAARLVEEMERTGVVSQLDGGFRDVLVAGVGEE